MNRSLLVLIALAVLAIVAIIGYVLFTPSPASSPGASTSDSQSGSQQTTTASSVLYRQRGGEYTLFIDSTRWSVKFESDTKTVFAHLTVPSTAQESELAAIANLTIWTENVYETPGVNTAGEWLAARKLTVQSPGVQESSQATINGLNMQRFILAPTSGSIKILYV